MYKNTCLDIFQLGKKNCCLFEFIENEVSIVLAIVHRPRSVLIEDIIWLSNEGPSEQT